MISGSERAYLQIIANNLGVNSSDLEKLIKFESGFNPKAKNPYSSARGLLQFTDRTAVSLGFKNSADLVKKHPTVLSQLSVVERYLSQFKPFYGKQSLYMSVFYPAARNWLSSREFPLSVQAVNPGIKTPADYVRKVEGGTVATLAAVPFLFAAGLITYFILKQKGERDV